jgi:hypothetical protein
MKKSLTLAFAFWFVLAIPGCSEDLSLVGESWLGSGGRGGSTANWTPA